MIPIPWPSWEERSKDREPAEEEEDEAEPVAFGSPLLLLEGGVLRFVLTLGEEEEEIAAAASGGEEEAADGEGFFFVRWSLRRQALPVVQGP